MKPRPACPKCGSRRFRKVGSFGPAGHTDDTAIAVYVECMKCEAVWGRGTGR